MPDKLITIVTPTYNRGYIIEKAIKSVLKQTYSKWEWFIIDDGSTDNTTEIVNHYAVSDARIHYVKNENNQGANVCRNLGCKLAQGFYIAFLDSDNYWYEDKLEKQILQFDSLDEQIAFVYAKENLIDGNYQKIVPSKCYSFSDLRNILLRENVIDTSTVLIKKEYFDLVHGFDENLPRLQDWELFFRMVVEYGLQAVGMNDILSVNVIQENSISKNGHKYIDAIFYILKKHEDYFEDNTLICHHIVNSILSVDTDSDYICEKIRENYPGNQELLLDILEKNINYVQSRKRQNALLYQWLLKRNTVAYKKLVGKKIAIYGLGRWGELFYQDIKNQPIIIAYGIDNKSEQFHDLDIKRPIEELPEVDCIIITVINEFTTIKKTLEKNYKGEVLSLEDLILS